ncbi:hypothetical protein M0802_007293 [Mischocyttarus mexicanus]|nr:hypothetical protein M0802_007293 [Mischocyttarus mexicanus]
MSVGLPRVVCLRCSNVHTPEIDKIPSSLSKRKPQTSEIITRSPLRAEGLYCPRDWNSKGRPVVRPTRA